MRTLATVIALGLAAAALAVAAGTASAGQADVLDVAVERTDDGDWRFRVTVAHADEGWEHYADQWQVLAPDGGVLGTRTLYHPHVEEQPFTRSLGGVRIPRDVREVTIRARDKVHGHGGKTVTVALPR